VSKATKQWEARTGAGSLAKAQQLLEGEAMEKAAAARRAAKEAGASVEDAEKAAERAFTAALAPSAAAAEPVSGCASSSPPLPSTASLYACLPLRRSPHASRPGSSRVSLDGGAGVQGNGSQSLSSMEQDEKERKKEKTAKQKRLKRRRQLETQLDDAEADLTELANQDDAKKVVAEVQKEMSARRYVVGCAPDGVAGGPAEGETWRELESDSEEEGESLGGELTAESTAAAAAAPAEVKDVAAASKAAASKAKKAKKAKKEGMVSKMFGAVAGVASAAKEVVKEGVQSVASSVGWEQKLAEAIPTVGLDLQVERKSAIRLAVERRDTAALGLLLAAGSRSGAAWHTSSDVLRAVDHAWARALHGGEGGTEEADGWRALLEQLWGAMPAGALSRWAMGEPTTDEVGVGFCGSLRTAPLHGCACEQVDTEWAAYEREKATKEEAGREPAGGRSRPSRPPQSGRRLAAQEPFLNLLGTFP